MANAQDPEYERLRATIAGPKPVTDPAEWKATCQRLGVGATPIPTLIKQKVENLRATSTAKKSD
jgi:hypothetical protein